MIENIYDLPDKISFLSPEEEIIYANKSIQNQIIDKNEYLTEILKQVKEVKGKIRKLNKQSSCLHEFKLKQVSKIDQYKCKKCKFEFSVIGA